MRYLAALALALGIGITAAIPAAHAGSDNGGGDVCYVSGAAYSCVQPAQLTLNTGSDAGSVAGPSPTMAPNQIPFYGGDRGN